MCITVTVLNIYYCLYSSATGGSPIAKSDTAKIAWIMLGVSVALSAVAVGTIVYRNRAKRNKRYFIQMLISLKFRILCFVAELFHDKNICGNRRYCFYVSVWACLSGVVLTPKPQVTFLTGQGSVTFDQIVSTRKPSLI